MPNLPPQAQKFVDDLEKKLREPGPLTNALGKVEQKTGVKRLHIFGGLTFSNNALCHILMTGFHLRNRSIQGHYHYKAAA
jgi:hypothetical protein